MYDVYIMIRTQVYLPPKLHKQAQIVAQLENVSLSELIRRGLTIVLKKNTHQKNDPLSHLEGKYSGGDSNAAINHNDIYKI